MSEPGDKRETRPSTDVSGETVRARRGNRARPRLRAVPSGDATDAPGRVPAIRPKPVARAAAASRRSALAPKVEGSEVTSTAGPQALRLSPAAWSAEALRIDHAAANRRRRRGFFLRMLGFVIVPTLLAAAYVYLYATPRYVSEFQVTYQTVSPPSTSGSSSLLSSLLGASSGGAAVDMTRVIWSYLTSETLLSKIDKQLDLRGHYSNPKIDWWDRLPAKASKEDFLIYFNKRVSIDDMMGGYVVVDVEAFDSKFAQAVATAMAAACDQMVENLTARARQEEVRVAEVQLKETQQRLLKSTLAVTNFRNEHVDFNPTMMAGQLDSVVGALESQLAQARATLTSDRTFLSEKAPQVVALKSQIAGLEKQIDAEKLRLANTNDVRTVGSRDSLGRDPTPYSKLVAEWTSLQLELKFATDSYLSAKAAYDLARVDAERKENYVEMFVKPNLPQRSTSPSPWTWIPAAFVVSLILYAIGSMMVGSFRDQAGI